MSLSRHVKENPYSVGEDGRPVKSKVTQKKDNSKVVFSDTTEYYDACGKFKPVAIAPVIALVVSLAVTFIFGMKIAVEFKGGTLLSFSISKHVGEANADAAVVPLTEADIPTAAIRGLVEQEGYGSVDVTKGTSFATKGETLNVSFTSSDGFSPEQQSVLTAKLDTAYPDVDIILLNSQDVNPSSGNQFFLKCLVAVILSFIILIIYIAARFKNIGGSSAGFFAVVGIFNDVIFVFTTFTLFRFSIDANFIAVALTILGYSINNTIVVYDRVRENKNLYGTQISLRKLVNMSIQQSFTRSLNTTITTSLALVVISIVSVLFGVTSILSFVFPMLIGFIAGFFSSLYLTGPLWVWYESKYGERNERNRRARKIKSLSHVQQY